jgi:stringent starvation protein B
MTPSRPYLLRAFYEWIVDNHATPYLVVAADLPGVDVPREYVENGRIILNISPQAVRSLSLENHHVSFNARFAGVPYDVYVPMRAVGAIYAKENGRGMVFKDEEDFQTDEKDDGGTGGGGSSNTKGAGPKKSGGGKKGGPNLTVVK